MHELSLSMPEPMLSLNMLILATYPLANSQHVLECSAHSERLERPERSERFWTPGKTVRGQHSVRQDVLVTSSFQAKPCNEWFGAAAANVRGDAAKEVVSTSFCHFH